MARGALVFCSLLVACSADVGQDTAYQTSDEPPLEVVVGTEDELAWAQHQANVDFAQGYAPTCSVGASGRPRVLVTGFGRFQSQSINATGLVVSALLDELSYPHTSPPAWDAIDPPGPQTAVAQGTVEIGGAEVELCAMVLPVFWDLAAYLVLEEATSFSPDLVIMNGVANHRQKLWFELGAVNEAVHAADGSSRLFPYEDGALLLPQTDETLRGNLAAWPQVRAAAEAAIEERVDLEEGGRRFDAFVLGAAFAGFPRSSNTYLCNNTTFTVGYGLDHPGEPLVLMEASHPREGAIASLTVTPMFDGWHTPRWFMHWPSGLRGAHVEAGAEVLRAVIAAQLGALDLAVPGSNERADL